MINILVITHGKFAEGILDSSRMIIGETEGVTWIELEPSFSLESFKEKVKEKIKNLNQGDGVLVFVDLISATPYNSVVYSMQELLNENIKCSVITGLNLPMLMEAILTKEDKNLEDLVQDVKKVGMESIKSLTNTEVL